VSVVAPRSGRVPFGAWPDLELSVLFVSLPSYDSLVDISTALLFLRVNAAVDWFATCFAVVSPQQDGRGNREREPRLQDPQSPLCW
jgi:hypothetical protein